ncbi:hypothetical protein ACA910_002301 [Epithemia clementina (nom. ined.)]
MDDWVEAQERLEQGRRQRVTSATGRSDTTSTVAFAEQTRPRECKTTSSQPTERAPGDRTHPRNTGTAVKNGGRDPGDDSSSSSSSSVSSHRSRKHGPEDEKASRKKDKKSSRKKAPRDRKPSSSSDEGRNGEGRHREKKRSDRSRRSKHRSSGRGRRRDDSVSSDGSESYSRDSDRSL